MRNSTLLIILAAWIGFFSKRAGAAPTTDPATADRTVVVISVDGLAAYYFDDPNAPMPHMRQIAKDGIRANSMRPAMPTVTWPNHTNLVTGVDPARHGVLANTYLDRETRKVVTLITDPVYDEPDIVRVPTIYDIAKRAGMTTAAVIWPATRSAPGLDWTIPDVVSNDILFKHSTPELIEECRKANIPLENLEGWNKAGDYESRDKMNTEVFKLILREHRPRLALLHLINVDHIEHGFGPQTPKSYEAIKLADDHVNDVWEELKKDAKDPTLIIVSDHGFVPYRQIIFPNVTLRKAQLLEAKGSRIVTARVQSLAEGGCAFIYVLDSANRDALITQAADLLKKVEGVNKIILPAEFESYGLLDPKTDARMADLVITAKSGYVFGDVAAGELDVTPPSETVRGTHGTDRNDPAMQASFMACGSGIKAGANLDKIDNRDVAPTVAALLGLKMKSVDGRVLDSILENSQKATTQP